MKKAILIATCVAAFSTFTTVGAFAQTSTGPAAQQDNMTKDKMGKEDGMKKEGTSTTGMTKDGMSKDGMAKDGMSKEGNVQGWNEKGRHEQVNLATDRAALIGGLFRFHAPCRTNGIWNEPFVISEITVRRGFSICRILLP